MARRIDEITEDMEMVFGLPEESLWFDRTPKGADFVVVPAEIAEKMIEFARTAKGA
jgi:hypothetical protein